MDIYEAHKKIKEKKVSCLELTQDCLKKAKASSSNAFISLLEDQALEASKKKDEVLLKEGVQTPLSGIPYSLKDLFVTKGIKTSAGSKMLYNYKPSYQGHVSECLEKSGGVLIGKNSCDEFGMGLSLIRI